MSYHKNTSNFQKESHNKVVENLFLLVIITIGVLGTLFFFRSSGPSHEDALNDFDDKINISMQMPRESHSPTSVGAAPADYLKIEGILQAGFPITFEVESFNERAGYTLDFGNGKKQVIKSRKIKFTYHRPGSYTIRLIVSFNGESKIMDWQTLRIEETEGIAYMY